MISELKKVRGLPWNVRAENLKTTIVTQQDQGPSEHRHAYLTDQGRGEGLVATLGCSGCVGLGSHTEGCRVRLEKALAVDERASAGVQSERESDRSLSLSLSLSSQLRRHSRSQRLHHLVLLCRCRHKALQNEQPCIRQWRWEHKNAESARERGQAKRRNE